MGTRSTGAAIDAAIDANVDVATGVPRPGAAIRTRDVAVGDHVFHVAESGPAGAETIVFLHGSGPGATGLSNWEAALGAFGHRHHCIAPDIIGFGDSSHPDPAPAGMVAYTDVRATAVLGLLDELGIRRCTLVGNSMGGMISLTVALRAPDRISRIVLMGTGGAPVPPTPELVRMIRFYDDPSAGTMVALMRAFVHDPAMFGDELDAIAAARLPRAVRADVRRSHLATFDMEAGPPVRFEPEQLATIAQPVLLIHGRDDRLIPYQSSLYFLEHLPDADLHVFARCGHWTQIEHPERFHATLSAFLDTRSNP